MTIISVLHNPDAMSIRMLTRLTIRNFKVFSDVEIELGERVVFIGPNNSGKTSALQALTLWDVGLKRWLAKRSHSTTSTRQRGVTINRQELLMIPVPAANLLWRDLRVRAGSKQGNNIKAGNVFIEIGVEGVNDSLWKCNLEFYYANEESFYCRPSHEIQKNVQMNVPDFLKHLQISYLPPMSGLAAREDRLEAGSIRARLGEGRTAEILRNLCWQVLQSQNGETKWQYISDSIQRLFGARLHKPEYIPERGEITMKYTTPTGTTLDISACGRGQQQTLLLLAHMAAHPGAVLLLDEPDAHLEILRQRQIYTVLSDQAATMGCQIIAASHSEVFLNEAAARDVVIAFIGQPHRINDRGTQLLKALRDISFDHYYLAEQTGWVLYLEGSTDLAILYALAQRLNHPAHEYLARPFVYYVANQPRKAQEHFYGLREAKPDLAGIAIYDRLATSLPDNPLIKQHTWRKRELENYICHREALLAYAASEGEKIGGIQSAREWRATMEKAIQEVEQALYTLGKDAWSDDIKASDEFLVPLFQRFFAMLRHPNLMNKTNFHILAQYVPLEAVDQEVIQVLDSIVDVARRARPFGKG